MMVVPMRTTRENITSSRTVITLRSITNLGNDTPTPDNRKASAVNSSFPADKC